MATNIPPHNLREIASAVIYIIDNPMRIEGSPEDREGAGFPTGGIIRGVEGVRNAYLTGRGIVRINAKAYIEEQKNGKEAILIKRYPTWSIRPT